jgi:plastocyanin
MKLWGVVAAMALGAAGCGGDDSTSVGPSTVPSADLAVSGGGDAGGGGGGDMATGTTAQTVMVMVGPNGTNTFSPATVTIHPGDTVTWTWVSGLHTVTSGTPGAADGKFCNVSGTPSVTACNSVSYAQSTGATYSQTDVFKTPGTYPYFCEVHGAAMTGTVISMP